MKQTFKKPSYYLLSQAMDGDEKAIEKILAFYDPYISKCCLRPLYDEYGNVYIVVDMELKGLIREALESIGDIAYAMENKKKMKQLHAVLLITGIPLNIIQWVSIILWITTGIQWLFWGYILVAIPYAIFIIRFLSKRIVYICPQCHEIFKPHLKEFIFSNLVFPKL